VTTPSRQEMFDRAVRGVRSQGFQQCSNGASCRYRHMRADGTVMRCVWGWVDPEGTESDPCGTVFFLRENKVGLAATLSEEDAEWARGLQVAHDGASEKVGDMESRLRRFGTDHGLVWPESDL
jgi:hypothetical protein